MLEMSKAVRAHVFGSNLLTNMDELSSADGESLDESVLTIKTISN